MPGPGKSNTAMSNEEESEAGSVQLLQYHRPAINSRRLSHSCRTGGDDHRPRYGYRSIQGRDEFHRSRRTLQAEAYGCAQRLPAGRQPRRPLQRFPPHHPQSQHTTLGASGRDSRRPVSHGWRSCSSTRMKSRSLKNFTLEELKKGGVEKFPSLELESGQRDADQVTVIDVPARRLKAIMPTADELELLAHVRFGINPRTYTQIKRSWRLSSQTGCLGRGKTSFAYLVSVEKRFKRVGGKYEFDYQGAVR